MRDLKSINRHNYFEKSFGQFHIVKDSSEINREPDFISYCKKDRNKISSRYWYTDKGVYRESNHWGQVAKCAWYLNAKKEFVKQNSGKILAFCSWKSMRQIEALDCWAGDLLGFVSKKDLKKLVLKSSFDDLYFEERYGTVRIVNGLGYNVSPNSYSPFKLIILDETTR